MITSVIKAIRVQSFVVLLPVLISAGAWAAEPAAAGSPPLEAREVVDFDFGWRFAKGVIAGAEQPDLNDSGWRQITVPHDWSIEDLEPLADPGPTIVVTKGIWRFAKGDDMAWNAPGFDDSKWEEVSLPARWEDHSKYTDEKCYGWYRRKFEVPAGMKGKAFRLAVGLIKDADQTFVNGVPVGSSGGFPPEFKSADNTDRYYTVAPEFVRGDGTNIVAVRVYRDRGFVGGIYQEQTPHTRSGPFDTKAVNGPAVGFTLGGTAWYRKHFRLPAAPTKDRVRIQFDGVYMNATVWINGNKLGNHPYGYTSFGYDLTPHLSPGGDNVIAVEVKNEGATSRWYSGSGIYRHVRLIRTGMLHVPIWGTYITTQDKSDHEALVRVRTQVANTSATRAAVRVQTQILAADGRDVASGMADGEIDAAGTHEFDQQLVVADPVRWSSDKPHLYTAVSKVMLDNKIVDRVTVRFGIRTISFDAKEGFKLNGQPMKLKGSCMHHDNGPLGAAAHDDAEYRRVRLTKAAGFNAIRCAHNPPSEAFLSACDELGVLVMDEAFDCWKGGKNAGDYGRYFDEWWNRDVDSMVLRDRNHPSIILWSIGNEIGGNETAPVAATARMLAERVRQLDPSRPVTSAVQGVSPKKDEFFAALDIGGYNYALKWNDGYQKNDPYLEDHQRHPERVMIGAESFAPQAFDYWKPAVDHPWVIGDFVWTGWDYLGESSIGWIGFGAPVYWPVAYCGDVSITGVRRPQSFYRAALFGDERVALFVQRPEPSFRHTRRYDWGSDDVVDSWNWTGREDKNLGVNVYSSCDEVELFLNGKSLGRRPTAAAQRFRADYGVNYQPGILKAVGYKNGQAVSESTLETAGKPAGIRLRPERTTIAADGQALAYLPFEVVDAKGRVNPDADNLVRFNVDGPGVLAAVGNDDPSSLESFQQPQRKAWRGRGLTIIKSAREPGPIRVTATSEGLAPASAVIETQTPGSTRIKNDHLDY